MAGTSGDFYRNHPDDRVWWQETPEERGDFLFSFDREKIYNLFSDYPWKLTAEEKTIFDRENPFWVSFFADRQEGGQKNEL